MRPLYRTSCIDYCFDGVLYRGFTKFVPDKLSYGKLVQKKRKNTIMDTCALVVFSVAAESVRNRAYMRHRCIYIPVAHSDPSETGDRAHGPIQKKREISKKWISIGNSLIAVLTAIREFPIEIHLLEISLFFCMGV